MLLLLDSWVDRSKFETKQKTTESTSRREDDTGSMFTAATETGTKSQRASYSRKMSEIHKSDLSVQRKWKRKRRMRLPTTTTETWINETPVDDNDDSSPDSASMDILLAFDETARMSLSSLESSVPFPIHATVSTSTNPNAVSSSSDTQQPPVVGGVSIAHGCLLIPVAVLLWWYWTKRTVQRAVRRLITFHGEERCTGPPPASPSMFADDDDRRNFSARYDNHHTRSDYYASFPPCRDTDQFHSWDDVMRQDVWNCHHIHDNNHTATNVGDTNSSGGEGRAHDDDNHCQNDATPAADSNTLRFVRWFKGKGTRNARARRRVKAATLHNLKCHNRHSPTNEESLNNPHHFPHSAPEPLLSPTQSSDSGGFFSTNGISGPVSMVAWQCIQNTTMAAAGSVELCAVATTSQTDTGRTTNY